MYSVRQVNNRGESWQDCFVLRLIPAEMSQTEPINEYSRKQVTVNSSSFLKTLFRFSWEPTCSSVSADGLFRGFLMRDILTKLWKATDLQAEDDYNNRTNIQCLNMLGGIAGSKELTTWFYL